MSNSPNQSGLSGPLTEREYLNKFAPLVESWDKAGFIDNEQVWGQRGKLKNDYMRAVVAQCLENARKSILPHSSGIEDALEIAKRAVEMFGGLAEATTPTQTSAMSGATNLPLVLGYIRKIMPKMFSLDLVVTQPLTLPTGRVFTLTRQRHDNGTDKGDVENRAGWSFRSFTATPGETSTISKSVRFTLTSADVTALTYKLKAETSVEIEQDLRAYHGLSAVELVSEAATDEIAAELDERILQLLWASASAGTFQIGAKPSGYTVEEWDRRFLEVVTRANEHIWTKKRVNPRHLVLGSNWTVQFSNTMDNYPGQVPTDDLFNLGNGMITRMGALGQYLTYKAALPFPVDQGILLHRGDSWVDAAAFYLPYVPLQVYSVWKDPATQVQTISWLTRDALHMNDSARIALLKYDTTNITGTSYPAYTEYV